MPKRIQRKRVKGWRMPPNTVYVGRPTRYGNPFVIGETRSWYNVTVDVTPERCLQMFRHSIHLKKMHDPDFLRRLRGKDLACWCKEGAPCHADILLELANQ